jgi:hypothetical protein
MEKNVIPAAIKTDLIREWPLLSETNLVVLFYLCASEIWPDKRGVLMKGGLLYIVVNF